jgi:PAS domain S-box-containing protein
MNALIKVCDHLAESAALLDHHGRYLYLNRAAERMLGRSRYEVIGKSYLEVFPDSTEVPFQPAFERAVAAKGAERFEAHIHSCNRWYDVEVYPLDTTVFVLWSDASERKRAEVALAQARSREQAFREQAREFGEMLRASLSRDLSDHLKEIASGVRRLVATADRSPEVEAIIARTQKAARVIEQLSDLAQLRLESSLPLNSASVDMLDLGRAVIEKLKRAHPHCTVACESVGATVGQGDPDRLQQVLFNLAESALEHDDAGSVLFRIDGTSPEGIEIRIQHSGTAARSSAPTDSNKEEARELVHHLAQNMVLAHGGTFHTDHTGAEGIAFVLHLPARAAQN